MNRGSTNRDSILVYAYPKIVLPDIGKKEKKASSIYLDVKDMGCFKGKQGIRNSHINVKC